MAGSFRSPAPFWSSPTIAVRPSGSPPSWAVRVIHVMTHDSIGLGEDGPTHQPVEHLAALRAIPNLLVFRPCDAVETIECWQLALAAHDRPSVLALTRQNLPQLRLAADDAQPLRGRRLRDRAGARRRRRFRCSPPAPRSRSRSRRRSSCTGAAWRRASCRCRASSCLRARPAAERQDDDRRRAGAGRGRGRHPAGLGRDHRLGRRLRRHDRRSAPARRPRSSTSISASPPRRSRRPH